MLILYFRVYRIHQRWASLHATLQNNLLPRLTSRSYVQEAVTLTRRTDVHTEARLVETNEAFKRIQQCLEWIQNKQIELEGSGFGSDLETTKEAMDYHKHVHKEIMDYKHEVDFCKAAKVGMDESRAVIIIAANVGMY